MKEFPPLPSVETPADEDGSDAVGHATAADVFHEGHLWTEELIDGDPLRFRVTDAGFLEFGDEDGVFDHDAVPLRYRSAVRTVREGFARDTFVAAVEDPGSVTFFGVATHARRLPYDLDRIPPFLGTALHDVDRERYLPPDTVRRAFERVGLPTIDPIEKELRAAHVDPQEYPIPDSRYYDGPAAGVVFHNKGGGRAVHRNSAIEEPEPPSKTDETRETRETSEMEDLDLDDRVTDAWLDRLVERSSVDAGIDPDATTVETIVDRAIERLARETPALTDAGHGPSENEVRSALAGRIDRYLRS